MKRSVIKAVSSALLSLSVLLAGCIFEDEEDNYTSRTPAAPSPTRAPSSATSSMVDDLPPLPDYPAAPVPDAPYPIPPGTRVSRTGQVSTGAVVKAGAITVERSENNLIKVDDPSHPLFGLEIRVPKDAYKSDLDYLVSYAPITNTSFKNVKPVSPLLTIETTGGYASEMVEVKLPVKLAADEFAMGFYYEPKTGQLEGLPLLDYDAGSVTIATRHFSSIFAGAVKLSVLDAAILNGDIDSGFRPGMDDWQFTNWGSFIASGGHCAGQSMTAMWYYVTRPDGPSADLWGRYDRNGQKPGTPALWQDDSQAYRFASVVQKDIDWDGWQNKLFNKLAGQSDIMTLRAFAYAMWVTGEPQYVGIRSSEGGHALVGYRVKDNLIYVSDPNIPGNGSRRIEYDAAAGKFKPYNGASKAGDKPQLYNLIRYVGKSAIINWNIITAHWDDLRAGKAGDSLFPRYSIFYIDEKGDEKDYKAGMVFTQSKIPIGSYVRGITTGHFYYRDGKEISPDAEGRISLVPGRNIIGVALYGIPPGKKSWEYIDYATLDITRVTLAIDPSVIQAQANQDCVFTASLPNPPAGVRYDWLVNGTRQQSGSSVTFKFRSASAGTYDITLKVYDGTGKELGVASASAVIKAASPTPTPTRTATPRPTTTTPTPTPTAVSRLAQLQRTTVFSASVGTADGTLSYRMEYPGSSRDARTFTVSGGSWNTGVAGGIKITWSGASFSGKDTIKSSNSTKVTTRTVQGAVSADGNTITSLSFSVVSKWPESENKEYQVVAQNISLARYWGESSSLFISGAQAASVITRVTEKTERAYNASTKSFTEVMTLTSVDWKMSDRNTAGASFE